MKSKLIKNEDSIAQVSVNANEKVWKDESEYKKAGENIEIKGFRKGKAPLNKIKANVNQLEVLYKAADTILNDLYKYALDTHSLIPVSQPKLNINKIDESALEVLFDIAIKPEFKLGEYKGLSAKKEEVLVSDDEVNQQIDALLAQHVNLEVKDKAIETGDTAIIDFEGFKDGIAFDGGKAESYALEIGSNTFIPGFEDQLIGKKANDDVEVNVTFPKEYQAADLAGQDVIFKVKVHEVKVKAKNELDDDFVKSIGKENINTVAELKEDVYNEIFKQKENNINNKYINDLVDQVLNNTNIKLAQMMIDNEKDAMYNELIQRVQQQGASEEVYLEMMKKTKEDIYKELEEDATKRIKYSLILEQIVEEEKIEVSDEDVDSKLEEMAKMYNMEVDQIKSYLPNLDSLKYEIRMQKAIDVIKDNAKN